MLHDHRLTGPKTSARTPMWIDKKDGDFLYRARNSCSDFGSSRAGISPSNVSQRVAFEMTVFPLQTCKQQLLRQRGCRSGLQSASHSVCLELGSSHAGISPSQLCFF